jgi:hypothetical protein
MPPDAQKDMTTAALAGLLEDAIPPGERTSEDLGRARGLLLGLLAEWGVVQLPGGRVQAGGPPGRPLPEGGSPARRR